MNDFNIFKTSSHFSWVLSGAFPPLSHIIKSVQHRWPRNTISQTGHTFRGTYLRKPSRTRPTRKQRFSAGTSKLFTNVWRAFSAFFTDDSRCSSSHANFWHFPTCRLSWRPLSSSTTWNLKKDDTTTNRTSQHDVDSTKNQTMPSMKLFYWESTWRNPALLSNRRQSQRWN